MSTGQFRHPRPADAGKFLTAARLLDFPETLVVSGKSTHIRLKISLSNKYGLFRLKPKKFCCCRSAVMIFLRSAQKNEHKGKLTPAELWRWQCQRFSPGSVFWKKATDSHTIFGNYFAEGDY